MQSKQYVVADPLASWMHILQFIHGEVLVQAIASPCAVKTGVVKAIREMMKMTVFI